MRILYVTDALAIKGGLERVLVDKVNWLVENAGDEISILTINQGGRPIAYSLNPKANLIDLDIPFHCQYRYYGWRRLVEVSRLHHQFREELHHQLKSLRPDIINCVRLDYISDLLRVKGNVPLVYESHSCFWGSHYEKTGFFRQIHTLWWNLKACRAQAVVALTEGDAKIWRKVGRRVWVIPNVVYLNEDKHYSDGLSKSVVFSGRLSKQKDIGSLLAIWKLVFEMHPDWTLHIYGEKGDADGSVFERLHKMADGIVLHDPVEHILDEYKKYSILLLTSLYEPFGLVLPEAMSCGLPVVSFDCPYGPADIITDEVDGYLIKNRDIEAFAETVCRLIENESLRKSLATAAIQSSLRYSSENIMPKWQDLFLKILSSK